MAADPWIAFDVHAGASPEALRPRARAEAPAALGELVEPLAAAGFLRLDRASSLRVRLFGAEPRARALKALGPADALLAVEASPGEWEVLRHLQAAYEGDGVWRLSGLIRGEFGTEAAAAVGAPAGAAVVGLDPAPPRAEVVAEERGEVLIWRAAPAGGPPGGPAAETVQAVWRGTALRPWAPVRLRARRTASGDLRLSWIRRARLYGDDWSGEPPLGEEVEAWRVEVLSETGAVLRSAETSEAGWTYAAAALAADFPAPPAVLTVRAAQISVRFGLGAWAVRRVRV